MNEQDTHFIDDITPSRFDGDLVDYSNNKIKNLIYRLLIAILSFSFGWFVSALLV